MQILKKFLLSALGGTALLTVSACAQQAAPAQAAADYASSANAASAAATPLAHEPSKFNSIKTSRPVLALTFDDGPHPELTPKLLDILRQKGVRATFFVLGSNVAKYPDIARRIVAEGHEIANHSYSHPALTKLGSARVNEEVEGTCVEIERATGRRPASMRPPYGALNGAVERSLTQDHGLDVVLWSVDPLDWRRPGSAEVTRRLVDGAKPGAILLAHDIHPGTIEAMPETISQLKAKGYYFATVGQLRALQDVTGPVAGIVHAGNAGR